MAGGYYSAAIFGAAAPATATDVFLVGGSATAKIYVMRFIVGGVQTTPGQAMIRLIKRSTLDTGGTFSTPLSVACDSAFPAPTAVLRSYSVLPTALGALV